MILWGIELKIATDIPPALNAVDFALSVFTPGGSSGGGGLASGTLLLDVISGSKYIYLDNTLIAGVG